MEISPLTFNLHNHGLKQNIKIMVHHLVNMVVLEVYTEYWEAWMKTVGEDTFLKTRVTILIKFV